MSSDDSKALEAYLLCKALAGPRMISARLQELSGLKIVRQSERNREVEVQSPAGESFREVRIPVSGIIRFIHIDGGPDAVVRRLFMRGENFLPNGGMTVRDIQNGTDMIRDLNFKFREGEILHLEIDAEISIGMILETPEIDGRTWNIEYSEPSGLEYEIVEWIFRENLLERAIGEPHGVYRVSDTGRDFVIELLAAGRSDLASTLEKAG